MASWDLFFSYRRQDLDRARPLLNALTEKGIRVWRDESQIPYQASITAEIRQAIATSRAFLAFYSGTYSESNPCQQELTTAWLAAEQLAPLATSRLWMVNPEKTFDHIPTAFRDQRIPLITPNPAGITTVVDVLKDRLEALDASTLGQGFRSRPAYFGMSPTQANRFIGRITELWDLHAMLTADRISIITGVSGQPTSQVRGLGGNGKSLLAREYAIAFGPAYPGGVFWLSASYGHDDAVESLNSEQREALRLNQIRGFAIENGVQTSGLTPADTETQFWETIKKRNARCLWIVDDVPSGLNQADFYRAWNGRWSGASTLITTRSKEYGTLGSVLDLGVLSPSEALHLLYSHLQPKSGAEEMAAHKIVDFLGYHPLAVELAGSYLAHGFDGFESYLDQLLDPNEDAVEFGGFLKEGLPTGHERSIRATFRKSIRQLGPEGQEFLRLASVLAVAPIPVSLISEVLDGPSGKERTIRAVNQAEVLSLCERSGDSSRTVHTLISRTMMSEFTDEGRTATLRSKAIDVIGKRLRKVDHIGEHAKISTALPHARYLLSHGLRDEEELTLASWLGIRDYERGDYKSARDLQEQALRAAIKLFGEDHSSTLSTMQHLALTLYESGDLPAARTMQESSLSAMSRLLGENNPQTLLAKHNLAVTLHAQGHLAEAESLDAEALAANRNLFGEEHANTLLAMQGLAQTLYARGSMVDAQNLQEKVLLISRQLLGEDHPKTLLAANNLAITRYILGRFGEAENLQREVLVASRRVAGEDHPNTLMAKNNLANTLLAQGRTVEAKGLLLEILPASNRVLSEHHPRTLTTMSNLALALSTEGDLAGAKSLQEHVLEKTEELLGNNHPDTIRAKNNLAEILRLLDDLTGARTLQEQVLEESRRTLGAEHDLTLVAMNNLAMVLASQSDFEGAQKLIERVLEARRREFGEEHFQTLLALENLGEILRERGNLARARELQEEVLNLRCRTLGERHAKTVFAMKALTLTLLLQATELYSSAATLFDRKDIIGARALGERADEISQRAKGLEHRATAIEGKQS
jgi:tetratricopeptide (TPR) repeat protein